MEINKVIEISESLENLAHELNTQISEAKRLGLRVNLRIQELPLYTQSGKAAHVFVDVCLTPSSLKSLASKFLKV